MEFDENKDEEIENKYSEDDYVDIYSKRAILGFSVFFGVIFGGVLLMLNLRAAGFKRAAWQVLLFSAFYHILSGVLISATGLRVNVAAIKAGASGTPLNPADMQTVISLYALTLLINLAGGLVLTRYFFKKYFPDNDYYPKPIWTPLLVAILIAIAASYIVRMG